jgi:transposase
VARRRASRAASRREGRPSKLTPKLQAEILRLLRAGNYVETAAHIVGLHPGTVHDWLARGARARGVTDQPFAEFSEAVRRAQAQAEATDVRRVGKAASKTWRAAAWRLERRHPRRWGPKVQLMVREQLEAFLDHLESQLDAAIFDSVLEVAEAWDGEVVRSSGGPGATEE